MDEYYEFCPRCEANLTLQKGYSNTLPFWVCKGCGEMLVNPEVDTEADIVWICDKCGAMLNIQEGFSEHGDIWKCTECGFENAIDPSAIYLSGEEYLSDQHNPYKGMRDEDVLELTAYQEIQSWRGHEKVFLVQHMENRKLYVKKVLTRYDVSVYRYLQEHPIAHMPQIMGVYEGTNHLVVIEEFIAGERLSEWLAHGGLPPKIAIWFAKNLCRILSELHHQKPAIIHRDVKPTNIMFSEDGEVYLLDMDAAKWHKPDEIQDTQLLGTLYYAAPEQFGYGFSGSSDKTDIYALGMVLNEMVTGKLPKEEKASGPIWDIIEKCICMEAKERYTADELLAALEECERKYDAGESNQ